MARLEFENGKVKDFTLVLCTRDYRKLGQLTGIKNVRYTANINSPNEISFSLTKHDLIHINGNTFDDIGLYTSIKAAIWEQLEDFKVVWVKETNEYFEIKVSTTDSLEVSKTIIGIPVPEAELSQLLLTAEINTEGDIARDDYEVTTFYNEENPKASLLHRVLTRATGYTIRYVDDSLKNLQRRFSISESAIYDFLVGECSEQFNCIFKFDSSDRTIWVYDLKSYGEDTSIYVDKNNLTDSVTLEIDAENTKNCFKLAAGDDYMTSTIRMLSPSGSDYIYHIPEYLRKDMPAELAAKLDAYDKLYNSYTAEYEQLVGEIYELYDDIEYLTSGMVPESSPVSSASEAAKLNTANLSVLGIYPLTDSTTKETVNAAMKNLAKVFVKTGYVKVEIDTENSDYYSDLKVWKGRFKVTNYSDEEDIAYSEYLTVPVHDNYKDFVEQKVLKNMTQYDDDGSIFDVLSIDELEDFKSAITLYSKNRLESFYDAIAAAQGVLQQLDQASEYADLYTTLYVPYTEKRNALGTVCNDCGKSIDSMDTVKQCPHCGSDNLYHGELIVRREQIKEKQGLLEAKEKRCGEIRDILDLETYLGEYYPLFSSYRRETVYSNDNYLSDGLSNAEMIARAKEFIETATAELLKSSEQQIMISSSLYNLLLIPEFSPLTDKFATGNWIRIRVDGVLYKLKLLSYSIDFDNAQVLNVEFSNISKVCNLDSEMRSILESAKSMGQSYGYVAKQADKGSIAQARIQDWIQNGLHTGQIQIQSGAHNEIVNDGHGLLCRAYDDISGTYDAKQLKLTHNCLVFTDNNWKSVRQALGEHSYSTYNRVKNNWEPKTGYGLTSDFVQSGQVAGATIVGGEIFSDNYSDGTNDREANGSYINLQDGTFSFGGGALVFRNGKLIIDSPSIPTSSQITEINQDYLENTDVYAENLRVNSANIKGTLKADQIDTENLHVKSAAVAESVEAENIKGKRLSGIEFVTLARNQLDEDVVGLYIGEDGFDFCWDASIPDFAENTFGHVRITGQKFSVIVGGEEMMRFSAQSGVSGGNTGKHVYFPNILYGRMAQVSEGEI